MSGESDQLARMGQQVVDAFTSAYDPRGDSTLALCLHPGQPVPDNVVQGGETNELVVSEWVGDQYDYPLLLKVGDRTQVVSTLRALSAKAAYANVVRWSRPAAAATDPAYPRLEQLIASARADLGEHPETLPFQLEPGDFAEPDCSAWQVFDQTITADAEASVTGPPPPPRRVRIDPQLWRVREAPGSVLTSLATLQLAAPPPPPPSPPQASGFASGLANRFRVGRALGVELASREAAVELAPERAFRLAALRTDADAASAIHVDRLAPARGFGKFAFNTALAREFAQVKFSDLAAQPGASQATEAHTSLHVHFEFAIVTVSRNLAGRPWWRADFLAESQWYVPGMARGAMVPDAPDAEHDYCLPQSLLLVRNVQLSGVWSAEARARMTQAVHYVGPFLMAVPDGQLVSDSQSGAAEATTITNAGVQVIGELCTSLPTLPPQDQPPDGGA